MPKQRHSVDLPKRDVDALQAVAEERGVTLSSVVYGMVVRAAWLAAHGQGRHLPQVPAGAHARKGTVNAGATRSVFWTQGRAEYDQCSRVIQAAGSTVTASVRIQVQEYVANGGDPLAMEWPPKSAWPVAA